MRICIALFFLFVNILLHGQEDSISKQKTILTELRKEKMVTDEHIGVAGELSVSYQIAKSLWDVSSIQTLIELTDDTSAVIRCYAFLGLIEKKADNAVLKAIVDKHQNDTSEITIMEGCLGGTETVILYMKSKLEQQKEKKHYH